MDHDTFFLDIKFRLTLSHVVASFNNCISKLAEDKPLSFQPWKIIVIAVVVGSRCSFVFEASARRSRECDTIHNLASKWPSRN